MSTWPLWTFVIWLAGRLLFIVTDDKPPEEKAAKLMMVPSFWLFILYHGSFFAPWGWAP